MDRSTLGVLGSSIICQRIWMKCASGKRQTDLCIVCGASRARELASIFLIPVSGINLENADLGQIPTEQREFARVQPSQRETLISHWRKIKEFGCNADGKGNIPCTVLPYPQGNSVLGWGIQPMVTFPWGKRIVVRGWLSWLNGTWLKKPISFQKLWVLGGTSILGWRRR